MQSKTSYFNRTLFRKNLTRFWPLWGSVSLLGSLAPLGLFAALIQYGGRFNPSHGMEMTFWYYSIVSWGVPVISLLYAVLCAMAVWSYLYNPRSTGMIHSLPITRKGLFVTNLLSGLAMMLIPYAITGTLTILVTLAMGLFEPAGLLVTILCVLGLSLFYFATATAVAFVTGNVFAMPALYFIFHFLAAGLELLISNLVSRFYYGVQWTWEGVTEWLSPTVCLCRNLSPQAEYGEAPYDNVLDSYFSSYKTVMTSVRLENGWIIAVYALIGLALLGGAYLLYQRRRSECAGDVVAVGWMKPVFRYGVALCAALSGGQALYSIIWEGFQINDTADALPMALCMAFAGLIGFYIASMLLAKSLRVFRRTWKGALGAAAAVMALCLAASLDPFGLERWTPDPAAVEHVSFNLNPPMGSAVAGTTQKPEDIQKLLDLHGAIVAERDSLQRYLGNGGRERRYGKDCWYAWARFTYELKDGRRVTRDYSLLYLPEDLQRDGAVSTMARLVTDPSMQEENIFGVVNKNNSRLTGGTIRAWNPADNDRTERELTPEEARTIEAAIRRDVQAGRFGRTLFLTDEAYEQAAYSDEIQLYYVSQNITDPVYEAGSRTYNNYIYLSFSTYCTETVQALQSLEGYGDDWVIMTYAQREEMETDGGRYYEYGVYTDDGRYYEYSDYSEDAVGVVYPRRPVPATGEVF